MNRIVTSLMLIIIAHILKLPWKQVHVLSLVIAWSTFANSPFISSVNNK